MRASFIPFRCLLISLLFFSVPAARAQSTGYWDARFFAPGVNDIVIGLGAHGTNLFATGAFNNAGEMAANAVARWSGGRWHALGEGISLPRSYNYGAATASDGSNVWVGGVFTNVGGVSVTGLAQWNGSAWSDVGGFNGRLGGDRKSVV